MWILWPHSWSFHRKPLCNQPPPQICLFDIIFVTDACSLLFQPSPDVEHLHCGDSTKFWFYDSTRARFLHFGLVLLSCKICLCTLSQKPSDFNIFFLPAQKAWPKPRISLITTTPPWDHFLCKTVSKLQRKRLYFFKLLDLSHLTDCVPKIWSDNLQKWQKKKRSALINKSSGRNLKLLPYTVCEICGLWYM